VLWCLGYQSIDFTFLEKFQGFCYTSNFHTQVPHPKCRKCHKSFICTLISHAPQHHEITYVTIPSQCGGEVCYMKVKILCSHELIINIHEKEINLV
jgi:hypothetical protein